MEISGTLGLTVIKTAKKYFIIFFDDHNNTTYCNDKNNYFVDDLIKSLIEMDKKKDICIFIEEYYNNNEYELIWQNQHVKKLQSFVNEIKKNKNICFYLTDIRLLLIPVSLEILDDNFEYMNIKVGIFFKNVINMFKTNILDDDILPNIIKKLYDNIIYEIKKYIIIYEDIIMREYVKKINILNVILLIDKIMDFYSICKIYNNNSSINIVYYGLAHSLLYISILFKLYECEIILNNGLSFTSNNRDVYLNDILIDEILKKQQFSSFINNKNCCILGYE